MTQTQHGRPNLLNACTLSDEEEVEVAEVPVHSGTGHEGQWGYVDALPRASVATAATLPTQSQKSQKQGHRRNNKTIIIEALK